jgi:GDP/UDP-N,N'-diacetylbacillosamine 2-epimerase (hydrolysing)
MRIGILTSSRADFGIYLPLLKKLRDDNFFDLKIIAFGTHISVFHGETIKNITALDFEVDYKIESMLLTDSSESISTAIGLTTIKFAAFWNQFAHEFDVIFCLGDRYEMFAAVTAAIPFNLHFAHIHGGETTTGAIDNVFRHAITLASKYHFVSTDQYKIRVAQLIDSEEHIYNVGALSLDNLKDIHLLSVEEFKAKWNVDLSLKTILMTFHPETVNTCKNHDYAMELINVITGNPEYQFLITMPNADTSGNSLRKTFNDLLKNARHVHLIENLGSQSYFTAMKSCAFLLGNTSSGIIEAASFGKYVINLGDRQKGRASSKNVLHVPVEFHSIQNAIQKIENSINFVGTNIYYQKDSADQIIEILKQTKSYAK